MKYDSASKPEETVKAPAPPTPEESLYNCDECTYEATTFYDLKEHKKDNHNKPDFKCDDCGHTVLTENDLNGHMEAYHRSQKTNSDNFQMIFLCNDCDNEFSAKCELEDHIQKEHTRVNDFACDKCEYTGTSVNDLDNHRKTIHFFFIYNCGACNFETTNTVVLRKHKINNHRDMIIETRKAKLTYL